MATREHQQRIWDITRVLREDLAMWPGDTPFGFSWVCQIKKGDTIDLGQVTMSTHAGTHADAPRHYAQNASSIDALDPAVYWGPAVVIDARGRERLENELLEGMDLAETPRVLFRTDTWRDEKAFPEVVPVLSGACIRRLIDGGVRLVGVDVPSVDPIDSTCLENHHALGRGGVHILESLDLRGVPAGVYDLCALPLRINGADGSPVRAVLRAI